MTTRKKVLAQLADGIVALPSSHPVRVAVNGRIASGKTTFAKELGQALVRLGRPVLHVGVDGFHNPSAVRYRQGRASARGYYEDAYDLAAVRRLLLDPLEESRMGNEGRWAVQTASLDLDTDKPVAPMRTYLGADTILVVDGSFLLAPVLRDAWDYAVYLEVSPSVATERGMHRDAAKLGGLESARKLHTDRYQAACDLYLEENRPAQIAQAVIDNEDFLQPMVRFNQR